LYYTVSGIIKPIGGRPVQSVQKQRDVTVAVCLLCAFLLNLLRVKFFIK